MALGSVRLPYVALPGELPQCHDHNAVDQEFKVMVMKMHSYLTFNGYLQYVSRQSQHLLTELQRATLKFGGWDQAIREAKVPISNESSLGTSIGPTRSGTPEVPKGSSSSYIDPASASILRKRLVAMALEQDINNRLRLLKRWPLTKRLTPRKFPPASRK